MLLKKSIKTASVSKELFAPMHLGVVKYDECIHPYCKGEPVKEIRYAFGCNAFGGAEAMILAIVVNHSPDIESCVSVRRNGDVFSGKLPDVCSCGIT